MTKLIIPPHLQEKNESNKDFNTLSRGDKVLLVDIKRQDILDAKFKIISIHYNKRNNPVIKLEYLDGGNVSIIEAGYGN